MAGDNKVRFDEVTNERLVCKNCIFRGDNLPTGICEVYTQCKPFKVLAGKECPSHEAE